MRHLAWIGAALALAGCGAQEAGSGERPGLSRYGISIEVPKGWHGEITRGIAHLERADASVVLHEYETSSPGEAGYFNDDWPVRLEPADFERRAKRVEDNHLVSVEGRLFSVFVSGSGAPPPDELKALNAALASIGVEAGDFYPGSAQPVAFPERSGWHIVSSGATPRYAYGEYVQTAAATIPYRDGPNEVPPMKTLAALPREGILVWVALSRSSRFPPSRLDRNEMYEPRRPPPYRLADLVRHDQWQGQVRDLPKYVLGAAAWDRHMVELQVYFGQSHPTEEMVAEADAVLRALELPDWGPWELDQAEDA